MSLAIFWPLSWAMFMCGVARIAGASRQSARLTFAWQYAATGIGGIVAYLIWWRPVPLAISVVQVIIGALLLWWWRRKDRKPALKSAGAKSRARLAAIVNRARDASRGSRPVLRPVQGGAS